MLIAAGWLVAAIVLSGSGFLQRLRPPAAQLIIAGLTIALLAAWRLSARFRQWLAIIDLRALVGLHLTRFVGLYFLLLCRRGELPCDFAISAGVGDVLVATLAAVLLMGWNRLGASRAVVGCWNALGLLDILFVVASAARHGIADPGSILALLRLPLSLLPTFLVPLILASHIVIFSRLAAEKDGMR
jgi:hypothetical protein